MKRRPSAYLPVLLLLFTFAPACQKAAQDTPGDTHQGGIPEPEAPTAASLGRKILTAAAESHLLNRFEMIPERTDFFLDAPFLVDSLGKEFSKVTIDAEEIRSLADGRDSCCVTFSDGRTVTLRYQNELQYEFTGDEPFSARHAAYPGDRLTFPFTVTRGGHGTLSFTAEVSGKTATEVSYDGESRTGTLAVTLPDEPDNESEIIFTVKDKYRKASSGSTVATYRFDVNPKEVTIPGEIGSTVEKAFRIDTDIPDCAFTTSRPEKGYFIVDGTTIIVMATNDSKYTRFSVFDVSEQSGRMPSVRVMVKQKSIYDTDDPDTPGEPDEPDEPEATVPESFGLTTPATLFEDHGAAFALTPEWNGTPAELGYGIEAFLDGKAVPILVNGESVPDNGEVNLQETNTVALDESIRLTAGRHRLQLRIVPMVGGAPYERTYELTKDIDVYGMNFRWFDEQYNKEIINRYNFKITSQGDRFSLLPESECPASAVSRIVMRRPQDGTVLGESTRIGERLRFNQTRRGPNYYEIEVTAADGTAYQWYQTIEVKECYETRLYISGNNLMAAVTGYRTAPDISFHIYANGLVRGVIPYTEAVIEGGKHVNKDVYEYKDFEEFGFDFAAEKGQRFREETLFSGNLNTYASMVSKHKSSVKAVKNKATRWKQNANGTWTKENYTPETYICIEMKMYFVKDEGENNEYIDMTYSYADIQRLVESYGMKLSVLMYERML